MNSAVDILKHRIENPVKYVDDTPIFLLNRSAFEAFSVLTGTAGYYHEPDEAGVGARVFGDHLDNAAPTRVEGFFGIEYHVVLTVDEFPVASVNLANLLAWSSDPRGRDGGIPPRILIEHSDKR